MEYLQKAAGKAAKLGKAASYAFSGLTEIEIKVLEATGKENWGVHGAVMAEIAKATRKREEFHLIMKTLWQRTEHRDEEWRHVYKALTLMVWGWPKQFCLSFSFFCIFCIRRTS
jgi:hypothetical protein